MRVTVVTAFVKLRRMALSVESLARKVAALEQRYDSTMIPVSAPSEAIRDLMEPPEPPRKPIGFQ